MRSKSGAMNPKRLLCCWAFLLCCSFQMGCINLDVQRKTQTSGTFESTGWGLTILGWDIPKSAIDIARENASDARLTNAKVTHTRITPYLGWFDWVLDIIGIRFARLRGTWGFSGKE